MDTCGSFSFGKLHEKLNFDLMALIAFPTAVFAALIGVMIAFFMAFHVDVVVLLIPFQMFDTVVLMAFIAVLIAVFAALTGV